MIPDDGPYHGYGTTCKFCKAPITIQIADSYDALADRNKIMPLAACNRCADIRVERRSLEFKVKFICEKRHLLGSRESSDSAEKAREILEKLLKQYANMIARWHFMEGMAWDDECLDGLMDKPGMWPAILGSLWRIFRASNPQAA